MDTNINIQNSILPEFSVTEISNKIKYLLEQNIGLVKIRGEISGFKMASSGHGYCNIKDKTSILAVTCWKPILLKTKFQLQDGIEVLITGKITGYAGTSKYQLSAENIQPYGIGTWIQIYNQQKEKFIKEGLFDKNRKKTLPYLPEIIGVITSITGSVIQDIIHRISDRFPTRIVIWPVPVQGENAAIEITKAIEGFNTIITKPDLIIVARGGGSIEDLWAFNEEIVVRAVAKSNIPIISAIGHETDYTLIDFVADIRAPTPTAAAEFAVPVLSDIKEHMINLGIRLKKSLYYTIDIKTQLIKNCNNSIKYISSYITYVQQRIDELSFKLTEMLPNYFKIKLYLIKSYNIIHPKNNIQIKQSKIDSNILIQKNIVLNKLTFFQNTLKLYDSLLSNLNYKNILKRGFVLVKSGDRIIKLKKDLTINDRNLILQYHDGEVKIQINE